MQEKARKNKLYFDTGSHKKTMAHNADHGNKEMIFSTNPINDG